MSLPTFNFLYIKAGTGKTGTSGDRLEQDWKYNFDLIKSLLSDVDLDLSKKITSNEIQQIKVEDGIAYFTTDNGASWTSLGPSFANLAGNPDDNAALVEKFRNYTTLVDFTALADRTTQAENNISILQTTTELLSTDVDLLKTEVEDPATGVIARVVTLEKDMKQKITSKSVVEIRERAEGLLEYTDDGTNWHPVAAATGVEWGEILGDINNQADLKLLFDNMNDLITQLNTSLSQTSADLTEHTSNYDNPHNVTPEQLGLGNVDNTPDADKPISTPQQVAINQAASSAASGLKIVALTKAQYEALTTKDATTNYRIIDINQ